MQSCPECLKPIESESTACPLCHTPYHPSCLGLTCIVAGCRRDDRPETPAAPRAVPVQHRVLAASPDVLFVLWAFFLSIAMLAGYFTASHETCDRLLASAVLAGLVVYPGRALRARNAPVRRGLIAAFLMCVALACVLVLSTEPRYVRDVLPEPIRILDQLTSAKCEHSSWTSRGQLFYDHGVEFFLASLVIAGLSFLFAVLGVLRDRPRARAAVVAVLPIVLALLVYSPPVTVR